MMRADRQRRGGRGFPIPRRRLRVTALVACAQVFCGAKGLIMSRIIKANQSVGGKSLGVMECTRSNSVERL